jgi:hypothetical protein
MTIERANEVMDTMHDTITEQMREIERLKALGAEMIYKLQSAVERLDEFQQGMLNNNETFIEHCRAILAKHAKAKGE